MADGTSLVVKIADEINKKRREELLTFFHKKTVFTEYIEKARKQKLFDKGSKSKVWRKVASLPPEVDIFFTRMYGKDYYKDKDFFTKHFTEWRVINDV